MKHDLKYIYGISGDKSARFRADTELEDDLIYEAKVSPWIAEKFFYSVRVGGREELGLAFSWASGSRVG